MVPCWRLGQPTVLLGIGGPVPLVGGPLEERHPGLGRARLAARPEAWIVPIPGTHRVERLDENLAAAVELTDDDLGEIERAAAQIQVQGARYPEQLQRLIDR